METQETSYTPGPWSVTSRERPVGDAYPIIEGPSGELISPAKAADAHLIAAAPDLLEAAEVMIAAAHTSGTRQEVEAFQMLRAAVAKAKPQKAKEERTSGEAPLAATVDWYEYAIFAHIATSLKRIADRIAPDEEQKSVNIAAPTVKIVVKIVALARPCTNREEGWGDNTCLSPEIEYGPEDWCDACLARYLANEPAEEVK